MKGERKGSFIKCRCFHVPVSVCVGQRKETEWKYRNAAGSLFLLFLVRHSVGFRSPSSAVFSELFGNSSGGTVGSGALGYYTILFFYIKPRYVNIKSTL